MNSFYLSIFDVIAQAKPSADQVESGFIYVIAAFTVVWLFIAAYLFWLNRRQENLQREVDLLRQEEAERQSQLQSQTTQPALEQPQAVRVGGQPAGIREEFQG